MKKCPYCAEEIQDEAILCRFCGKDLRAPVPETVQVATALPVIAPHSSAQSESVWRPAAKASGIISGLYILSLFLTPRSEADIIGSLTVGLATTFVGWWVVCAGIIWVWRKLDTPIAKVLFVAGLAFLCLLALGFLNS